MILLKPEKLQQWPPMLYLLSQSLFQPFWCSSFARDLKLWKLRLPRHHSILLFWKLINKADGDLSNQDTSSLEDSWLLFSFQCQLIILSSSCNMCLFSCLPMLMFCIWLLSSHTNHRFSTTTYCQTRHSILHSLLLFSSSQMPHQSFILNSVQV